LLPTLADVTARSDRLVNVTWEMRGLDRSDAVAPDVRASADLHCCSIRVRILHWSHGVVGDEEAARAVCDLTGTHFRGTSRMAQHFAARDHGKAAHVLRKILWAGLCCAD
jgi:hypothetical protein